MPIFRLPFFQLPKQLLPSLLDTNFALPFSYPVIFHCRIFPLPNFLLPIFTVAIFSVAFFSAAVISYINFYVALFFYPLIFRCRFLLLPDFPFAQFSLPFAHTLPFLQLVALFSVALFTVAVFAVNRHETLRPPAGFSFFQVQETDLLSYAYVGPIALFTDELCAVYNIVDVDECVEGLDTCQHQCINTVGGYRCACRPGYRRISRSKCAGIPVSNQQAHQSWKWTNVWNPTQLWQAMENYSMTNPARHWHSPIINYLKW